MLLPITYAFFREHVLLGLNNSSNNSSQSVKAVASYPVLQVPKTDCPFTQAGAALVKGFAGELHAPQLAASVPRFASQPLLATPSQFPNLQEKKVLCVMHMLLLTIYPSCCQQHAGNHMLRWIH
jgi:hypothetical protein